MVTQRFDSTRLMRVGEVAGILHVHPNTLRKWSDQGLIPTYRIGQRRDRRFAVEDLLAFLTRGGNGMEASPLITPKITKRGDVNVETLQDN